MLGVWTVNGDMTPGVISFYIMTALIPETGHLTPTPSLSLALRAHIEHQCSTSPNSDISPFTTC